jgi:hypothetical protein
VNDIEILEQLDIVTRLLQAVANEPEVFFDIIGERRANILFQSAYFAGLAERVNHDQR